MISREKIVKLARKVFPPGPTEQLVISLAEQRGIDPAKADAFLTANLGFDGVEKAAFTMAGVGGIAGLILGPLFAAAPEIPNTLATYMPWLGLPDRIQDAINYLHGMRSVHVPVAHLIPHLPEIGFDTVIFAGATGAGKTLLNQFTWRKDYPRFKASLERLMENGGYNKSDEMKLSWKMKPDYTALFVGNGDPLGKEFLSNKEPNEALMYATQKQGEYPIWVKLSTEPSLDEMKGAFELGDFHNCGEIVLMPVTAQDTVFPPDGSYDLSPSAIKNIVSNIRYYEREIEVGSNKEGQKQRPIIIVGDKTQTESFRSHSVTGNQSSASINSINLGTIKDEYDGVIIIDPTELILSRIVEFAKGARIELRGNQEAIDRYGFQFEKRLMGAKEEGGFEYRVTTQERTVFVGYNVTDIPTVSDDQNVLYVVLSAGARDDLLQKGTQPERVLYVPGIVKEAMDKETSKQ